VLLRDRQDLIDRRHAAQHVHRQYDLRPRAQTTGKSRRVHAQCVVDLGEHGVCAGRHDRLHGAHEAETLCNDFVPGTDFERVERDFERSGARGHRRRARRLHPGCEVTLELPDLVRRSPVVETMRPEDPAAFEHFTYGLAFLAPDEFPPRHAEDTIAVSRGEWCDRSLVVVATCAVDPRIRLGRRRLRGQ
jgi:hypothetical protein